MVSDTEIAPESSTDSPTHHMRFTDEEREDFSKLTTDDAKRSFLSLHFKRNFADFVYLLGYRDTGEFHRREIENIASVRRLEGASRRLWLWSRGFFKTSLITESHTLWLIVNNPDIRILLVSNTISIAEDILRNIKNHLISNAEFRYFFPEFCPVANSMGKIEFGTTQDFTVACRTQARKEPTVMVAGIGTNLTGLHFDYMKLDDLVTKDSVTNDTQIIASKEYYGALRHLFDKTAVPREDVVGTIYHFNDLYHHTLRGSGLFVESFVPAVVNGEAVFPERLPLTEIERLMSDPSVGPYQVQTQYFLNPINPEKAKFKEAWLQYYDEVPEGLAEYILVDPASTTKKKSDYTVIERWGVSHDGAHYLLEGIRDKLTAFARIEKLFEVVGHARNLKWVKYEVIGGRHGDLEIIEQKKREKSKFFTIKETKSTTASKVDRIEQRLVGIYHAGKVLLPRRLPFKSQYDGKVYDFVALLKLEFLQFPFTEHDDILDCQAQMFDEPLIKGSIESVKVERKNFKDLSADDWEKIYKNIENYRSKFPGLSYEQILNKTSSAQTGRKLKKLVKR